MNLLPVEFLSLMLTFAPLFSKRVWHSVLVLVVGAILAPGKRTVTAILGVMGMSQETHFPNYHRVLNRAAWSSRQASQLLLKQLVAMFAPRGVLVMGLDDTIERRQGKRIAAKGIYRDPVRSSHEHFVMRQWIEVAEFNVTGEDSLGTTSLGTAIFDSLSSIRTLSPNS